MLIISRKPGESFLIGDGIEVVVLDVSSDRAKIGIRAPGDVKIVRRELLEVERANRESSESSLSLAGPAVDLLRRGEK